MDLSFLSEVQQRAVRATEGPVLVLAGAGSGKTSVLTNRVAYLVNEKGVDPFSILAITFTNKAANEMKERISALVDFDVSRMAISTFHSMCAKFLRFDADKIGYERNFSIYDTDDCITVLKRVLEAKGMDVKHARRVLSHISNIKNNEAKMTPEDYAAQAMQADSSMQALPSIYREYCDRLRRENAMDFDDLLLNMLRVLRESEAAREYYQNRFRYIMVDEYQDTNSVQYELVHILADKYKNLFVVGDDDQSIYAWRGADIRNILDFERDYQNTQVIKLEQNYRSHAKILDAANAVIQKAEERKQKTLWSARKTGALPKVYTAPNEYAEAEFVAREISSLVSQGKNYTDFVVLYRTHTQSRVLEEKLRIYGIPYQIFGGMSFFARKEIKDMVAYLTVYENPMADTALARIVNVPRRGIGDVSLQKLRGFAAAHALSLLEAMERADEFMSGGRAKFASFLETVDKIRASCEDKGVGEIVEAVFAASGYRDMLMEDESIEGQTKIENVEEFINSAYAYEKENEEPTLEGFLSSVSLISDADTVSQEGSVTLMTMHSAKGLEFDTVFLVGMEENLFPSKRSVDSGKLDEERRLCYVGITRAKNTLYFTNCMTRNLYSGQSENYPSRFLMDIPKHMMEELTPISRMPRREKAPAASPKPIFFQKKAEFKPQAQEAAGDFAPGMVVEHKKFGQGKIKSIMGEGDQKVAVVSFADAERKLFLSFAPLKIIK